MDRELVLIGGGGHCRSVIEAAESCGRTIRGILDLPELLGCRCLGYEVIGNDSDIPRYAGECDFIVTLGQISTPDRRIELHRLVEEAGGNLATVIASVACVSRHAAIMPGTVVLHNACINAGACIGRGCIINTAAVVEHDCTVGDWCHISTGVIVNGGCAIGDGCFIGSGAVVRNSVSIAERTLVGAASLVTRNIESPGVYYGVPAKRR